MRPSLLYSVNYYTWCLGDHDKYNMAMFLSHLYIWNSCTGKKQFYMEMPHRLYKQWNQYKAGKFLNGFNEPEYKTID